MKIFTSMKNLLLLALFLVTGQAIAQTNLLKNPGFETWTNDVADGWKSVSSASSATVLKSEEARSGDYAVLVKGAADNKRLATAEMKLKAGTYIYTIYAQAATSVGSTITAGYVPMKSDGSADGNKYNYGMYYDLTDQDWTLVADTFTLSQPTTICLVTMLPKNKVDFIVDDASLTTTDGGLDVNEPIIPETPTTVGDGTKEKPYTVADVFELKNSTGSTKVWVEGFIVGYIKGKTINDVIFSASDSVMSNILIAASATINDVSLCLPVQLPSGAMREQLNLKTNPTNLGKSVKLYASLEKYFSVTGVKNTSDCVIEGQQPEESDSAYVYAKATTVASGSKYLFTAITNDTLKLATSVSTGYGYIPTMDVETVNSEITLASKKNEYTFIAAAGGYTIQDAKGRYLYMTGTYNSFNFADQVTEGHIWIVTAEADGTFKILNSLKNKYIQYERGHKTFGSYAGVNGLMPTLYEKARSVELGMDVVDVDNNDPIEVFTLNGIKVGFNLNGQPKGIYIVKQANKIKKIIK